MSLKQLNKSSLVELAFRLGISDEGTKLILEERLAEHFDNHPELEGYAEYKKFIQFRRRNSPKKVTQDTLSSSGKILQPLNDTLNSSPSKLLSIGRRFRGGLSSPGKAEEESEESDESKESDDDDHEEDEIEVYAKDNELQEKEIEVNQVEDDNPENVASRFEFITTWKDALIGKYEEGYEYIHNTYEGFVYDTKQKSTEIRKTLSTADSVIIITQTVEASLFLYNQVPIIRLGQASFLDQNILKNWRFIDKSLPIWDLSVFAQTKFLASLIVWGLLSFIIPAIGSYYFNFISKKFKRAKFDPFVFNLVKLLLAYFYLSGNVSFNDVKNNAEIWADEHILLDNISLFQNFKAHFFHATITLKLILGNQPFVGGIIGALVALYVAAI